MKLLVMEAETLTIWVSRGQAAHDVDGTIEERSHSLSTGLGHGCHGCVNLEDGVVQVVGVHHRLIVGVVTAQDENLIPIPNCLACSIRRSSASCTSSGWTGNWQINRTLSLLVWLPIWIPLCRGQLADLQHQDGIQSSMKVGTIGRWTPRALAGASCLRFSGHGIAGRTRPHLSGRSWQLLSWSTEIPMATEFAAVIGTAECLACSITRLPAPYSLPSRAVSVCMAGLPWSILIAMCAMPL